jgi:SAM-dependent methyltransferase
MTERWQVAGAAAEAYERHLVPAFFGPFAERLIELAEPRPGDRVLDVACGTGIVARQIAPHTSSTTGVDLNQGMLEVARATDPSIEWLHADACALPLPDASFDLVLCQQGVQFFPDRGTGLREMRRVLAPGGRLAVSVWRAALHNPGWLRLAETLERHAGEAGAMMRAPFSLSDGAELRDLVRSAGFRDVSLRIAVLPVRFPSAGDLLDYQEVASPLAGPLAELSGEARDGLAHDFTDALLPHTDDEGVCFPMETHIVVAA